MAIMAHPDDVEFTSAGTVARWCAQGGTAYYVIATSGDKGGQEGYTPQELAALREREQREAARVLGVKDVFFLRLPDGLLQATPELSQQLAHLLSEHRVDVVLTWDDLSSHLDHADHRNIGLAVRQVVCAARDGRPSTSEREGEGVEPHCVTALLLVGSQNPNYFVHIGRFLEKKVDAILCHRSQVGGQSREDMMKRFRGLSRVVHHLAARLACRGGLVERFTLLLMTSTPGASAEMLLGAGTCWRSARVPAPAPSSQRRTPCRQDVISHMLSSTPDRPCVNIV